MSISFACVGREETPAGSRNLASGVFQDCFVGDLTSDLSTCPRGTAFGNQALLCSPSPMLNSCGGRMLRNWQKCDPDHQLMLWTTETPEPVNAPCPVVLPKVLQ